MDQRIGGWQGTGGKISLGRADIIIAQHRKGLEGIKPVLHHAAQPVHPGELIGKAGITPGIAIGKVYPGCPETRRRHFNIAGLGIFGITG